MAQSANFEKKKKLNRTFYMADKNIEPNLRNKGFRQNSGIHTETVAGEIRISYEMRA